jgi:hypothetical protein
VTVAVYALKMLLDRRCPSKQARHMRLSCDMQLNDAERQEHADSRPALRLEGSDKLAMLLLRLALHPSQPGGDCVYHDGLNVSLLVVAETAIHLESGA